MPSKCGLGKLPRVLGGASFITAVLCLLTLMFSPVQSTDRESLFTARIDLDVGVVGFGPWDIAAADLNGDGHIDLTTANKYSGSISVVLNKGGSFERVWNKVIGNSPTSLALADLDGDEDID
ncbi:MAG: FG-GAP repeat domain-containing protein, partial [Thermoplasmata archaeon]